MSGFNKPISGLDKKNIDINSIIKDYTDDNMFYSLGIDEIYLPVADNDLGAYYSKKVDLLSMLRAYSYTVGFSEDITRILKQLGYVYDVYINNELHKPVDGRLDIDIDKYIKLITYTKQEIDDKLIEVDNQIDDLIVRIDGIDSEINSIKGDITTLSEGVEYLSSVRYNYDIRVEYDEINKSVKLFINNEINNNIIENNNGYIITIDNNTEIFKGEFYIPNVSAFEKIGDIYNSATIPTTIKRDGVKNEIKLYLNNTQNFEGRIIIN